MGWGGESGGYFSYCFRWSRGHFATPQERSVSLCTATSRLPYLACCHRDLVPEKSQEPNGFQLSDLDPASHAETQVHVQSGKWIVSLWIPTLTLTLLPFCLNSLAAF